MNTKKTFSVMITIVLASIAVVFASSYTLDFDNTNKIGFTYSDSKLIKNVLSSKDIFMSTPIRISDYTVKQYCMYFDQDNDQHIMDYCLTSALTNLHGEPLGNINIGGNSEHPQMAVALIETSDIDSRQETIVSVFDTLIDVLVCDCWEEQQPGGFASVSDWIAAAKAYYVESEQNSTKSKISGLVGNQLILEITSTGDSYLWTLIVLK
ncbi:hypothetical protein NsoK4_02480 [Nitrosopumilus sp. K4]|uniref:hypothetical protein n=1 Tax=Nitrosopumilus sp. K4 TaxID=2795383 RepID=UPI001BAE3DF3|nr:hypothetical protein [Nitrosopumilus sp. K4]QUC65151.1 hypothetical protein NsoK4_02480 [Nitrosopumilus sp. K4]